jgi:hypothetical protein
MGADFSQPQYKNLLISLMPGSMDASPSGNTVLYMSTVMYVDSGECQRGGLSGKGGTCPNYQKIVFTRQIPVGNTQVSPSAFGTPGCPKSNGYTCTQAYYLTNPNAVANGFSNVINLTSSAQFAYMSEMYTQSSDLVIYSSLGTPAVYARSIF